MLNPVTVSVSESASVSLVRTFPVLLVLSSITVRLSFTGVGARFGTISEFSALSTRSDELPTKV